jgi:hypothetical protein
MLEKALIQVGSAEHGEIQEPRLGVASFSDLFLTPAKKLWA